MSNYFRYENQPCPICKQNFQLNDDIVVCPVCGSPHHRECYKKNGECGNFEKHNDGFRWTPIVPETPVVEPNFAPPPPPPPQQPFNPQVNPQFNPQYNPQYNPQVNPQFNPQAPHPNFVPSVPNYVTLFPKNLEDDVLTEEVASFVVSNDAKYLQNFFYTKSGKKTFNWAAFFFAPYWFFYRKMYKLGAIFLAVMVLISVSFSFIPSVQKLENDLNSWSEKYQDVSEFTDEEVQNAYKEQAKMFTNNKLGVVLTLVSMTLEILFGLFVGFNANKWYYNHSIKTIRKIKSEEPDPQRQKLLFFKTGGVSMGAAILSVLVETMIVGVLGNLALFF